MRELDSTNGIGFSAKGHLALGNLEKMKKPVLAAVNGYALGGGLDLALACDIIYASESAKLGLQEVTLGVVPGFGGTQRLTRRVGPGRAKELIFPGKTINAHEAYGLGIVDRGVPDDLLMAEVYALASTIAGVAPLAVQRAKDCILAAPAMDIVAG